MNKITLHDTDYPKIRDLIFDDKGNYLSEDILVDVSMIYPTITFLNHEDYIAFKELIRELGIKER